MYSPLPLFMASMLVFLLALLMALMVLIVLFSTSTVLPLSWQCALLELLASPQASASSRLMVLFLALLVLLMVTFVWSFWCSSSRPPWYSSGSLCSLTSR